MAVDKETLQKIIDRLESELPSEMGPRVTYDPEISPLASQELIRIIINEVGAWEIPSHEVVLARRRAWINVLGQSEERSRELITNWRDFCQAVREGMEQLRTGGLKFDNPKTEWARHMAPAYAMRCSGLGGMEPTNLTLTGLEKQVHQAERAFSNLLGEGEMEEGDSDAAVWLVDTFAEHFLEQYLKPSLDEPFS
jgi:hypothetical protein